MASAQNSSDKAKKQAPVGKTTNRKQPKPYYLPFVYRK
jgi:hypothetical protein